MCEVCVFACVCLLEIKRQDGGGRVWELVRVCAWKSEGVRDKSECGE
jgi:hypothetical protein